jgi:hypothetical protein
MKPPRIDLYGLWQKRGKRNLLIALGVTGCLAIGALGSTLAANISLNSGEVVEFGQGVVQTTACDSQVIMTPKSEFVNGIPGEFKLTEIDFSDFDTTDQSGGSQGCAGKYFELKVYNDNGDLSSPTISFAVRSNGTFVSEDGEMTTEFASSETSTATLTFETATVSAADVSRITIQSSTIDECYGEGIFSDGATECTAALSGYWLAQNFPSSPSGFYWIQSESMTAPLQMYVDMTEEGGGYDFYFITDDPGAEYVDRPNGGTSLGLDLVMPRSKFHWRAMRNAVLNHRPAGSWGEYFRTAYGIYRDTDSSFNGDYTSVAMNSASAASPDWKVKDGGRWWLSDDPFSEPNGDYAPYGLLCFGMAESWNFEPFNFNDQGTCSTGSYYLVSTNAKP